MTLSTTLRKHGLKVIFDAEHFYQGYLDNRDYAISVLKAAKDAGSALLYWQTPMVALCRKTYTASQKRLLAL